MLDPELLNKYIEQLHTNRKLESQLKEIDRYLYSGYYHLNCLKTYEKETEHWIYELGEAGGSFYAAGKALIALHQELDKADEQ